MLQIDSRVWNQIAPLARDPVWQRRMAMQHEPLVAELEAMADRLRAQGVPSIVVLAYQQAAPLLQERPAIQSFLKTNPQFREALPEVLSVNEAILLMVNEHHLTVSQTRVLRKLLAETPPA